VAERSDWDEWEDELPPVGYAHERQPIPADAQQMGLDRNTEEGALVAMAGSLNPGRPVHRMVAWVLLAAFSLPLLITLAHELL
jgi:hypothetical protein